MSEVGEREPIRTCDVAAAIMKADPSVSEDQALEIAGELDSHDSWYGGRDGKVEVVVDGWQEQERICRVVSDIVDTPDKSKIQSVLINMLTYRPAIPPAPGREPVEVAPEPELQQASSLQIDMLAFYLEKVAKSPLIDPALRSEIQTAAEIARRHAPEFDQSKRIVNDPLITELCRSNPEFKRIFREAVVLGEWSRGLKERIGSGVLTSEDAKTLKQAFETMKQYDRMVSEARAGVKLGQELREAQVTVSGVAPSYSSEALRNIRSMGVAFRQSAGAAANAVGRVGTAVRGAGISVSQSGGAVPNLMARGVAIGVGATLVAVGAVAGLAYYLDRRESPKDPVAVPQPQPSSPRGSVTVLEEIRIEGDPTIYQLEDLPNADPRPVRAGGTRATGPK